MVTPRERAQHALILIINWWRGQDVAIRKSCDVYIPLLDPLRTDRRGNEACYNNNIINYYVSNDAKIIISASFK